VNVERFNRHIDAGRERAEQHVSAIERGYRITLRAAGRLAAERFSTLATDHLTAAVDPKWSPPEDSQLLDEQGLQADAKKRTKAAHKAALAAVMAPALDEIGVSSDLTNPLVAGLIDQLGARASDLGDAIRQQIAAAVMDSYQQGLSIAGTASAIQDAVEGISDVRATMLARTDMIGLVNGGSIAAARLVNSASESGEPQVGYKQWLSTADERTRDTHAEADGQVVPIDQPFQVGDEQADFPGDPGLSDEEAANCRCTVTYMEAAGALTDSEDMALAAASGPEVSNLAMVAVYPRPNEAQSLATPEGQEVDSLHVTLLFLGDADELDAPRVHQVAESVSASLPQLDGTVGGVASFSETPDGFPAIILPDVKGLSTLQESLRAALADAGIESPSEHGFLPHMTLDYAETPTPPDDSVIGSPLHFDALSVVVGGKRTDYQLTGDAGSPTDDVASRGHMATSPEDTLTADVTITVGDEAAGEAADAAQVRWQAVLCVEGEPTEDGRMLEAGSITWRELPLSLGVMFETPHSFEASAEIGGRIDRIWRDGNLIRGEGVFTQDDVGQRAAQMVADLTLRGISVDLGVLAYELREADPPVATDETDDAPDQGADVADVITEIDNLLFVVTEGVIGAATVCPYQAIAGATIAVVADAGTDSARFTQNSCFVLTVEKPAPQAELVAAGWAPRIDDLAGRVEQLAATLAESDLARADEIRGLRALVAAAVEEATVPKKLLTDIDVSLSSLSQEITRKPRTVEFVRDAEGNLVGTREG
jgi:2'-5' RNA ligase